MAPITAKAGDAIRIDKQLTEGSGRDGTPVDLTDETVRVYVQYDDNALVANQEVEYVDRPNGKIAVELQPSQTSNIGRHNIEWVVDPQGDPTTFPADSYDTLRTESPLDRELTPSAETPPDLTVTTLTVEGDADLTGGDLTGVGAFEAESVSAETTDSGEYLRGGSDIEQWVLLDRQTDVTSVNVQTDSFETLKVTFTSTSATIAEMTVDENSTQNYAQLSISDSGITSQTGQTAWTLVNAASFGSCPAEFVLGNRGSGDRGGIIGNAATQNVSRESLIRGGINDSSTDFNSVQIADTNGGGFDIIEVWGKAES